MVNDMKGLALMSEYIQPLYKSVGHALRCAYFAVVKVPYKVPSIAPASKEFNPNTWEDYAGNAGMIMMCMRDTLSAHHQSVINALYIVPEEAELIETKQACCNAIATDIANYHRADSQFIHSTVRSWAGFTERESFEQWAEKLNVTTRTIHNWRNGWDTQRGRSHGINEILDRKLNTAHGLLAPVFRLNGWIE